MSSLFTEQLPNLPKINYINKIKHIVYALITGTIPNLPQINYVYLITHSVLFDNWSTTEFTQNQLSKIVNTGCMIYSLVNYRIYTNIDSVKQLKPSFCFIYWPNNKYTPNRLGKIANTYCLFQSLVNYRNNPKLTR